MVDMRCYGDPTAPDEDYIKAESWSHAQQLYNIAVPIVKAVCCLTS